MALRMPLAQIRAFVEGFVDRRYFPLQSPMHELHHLELSSNCSKRSRVWIKRDDLLGGVTANGSKFRKYSSLIPYLKNHGYEEALIHGGAYSNNVLGLSQMLRQNGIRPTLLLQPKKLLPQSDLNTEEVPRSLLIGNWSLTRTLLHPSMLSLKDREADLMKEKTAAGKKTLVIPEGSSISASLPGALTLPLEILEQEKESNISFDHVFVDSGTSQMAAAVCALFAALRKPTRVHVVHVAPLLNQVAENVDKWARELQQLFEQEGKRLSSSCSSSIMSTERDEEEKEKGAVLRELAANMRFPLTNFRVLSPTLAHSFGYVNQKTMDSIINFARSNSILLDPLYTGKLIPTLMAELESDSVRGNVLVIHSGGVQSLLGYPEQLANAIVRKDPDQEKKSASSTNVSSSTETTKKKKIDYQIPQGKPILKKKEEISPLSSQHPDWKELLQEG